MELKDSGKRREFKTGAVRDICKGKGRCDLLPLDVVGNLEKDPLLIGINEYGIDIDEWNKEENP